MDAAFIIFIEAFTIMTHYSNKYHAFSNWLMLISGLRTSLFFLFLCVYVSNSVKTHSTKPTRHLKMIIVCGIIKKTPPKLQFHTHFSRNGYFFIVVWLNAKRFERRLMLRIKVHILEPKACQHIHTTFVRSLCQTIRNK